MAKCSKQHKRLGATCLSVVFGLLLMSGIAQATTTIGQAEIETATPIPEAIRRRISDLLSDTLTALFSANGTLTVEALQANPTGVAAQVQSGINFELEDLGYRLTELSLGTEEDVTPSGEDVVVVTSAGMIDLVGGGVATVNLTLAETSLPDFWKSRHEARLATVTDAVTTILAPHIIGLPVGPRDPDWARLQVAEQWTVPRELSSAWPDHTVTIEVSVEPDAQIQIHLTPIEPLVTTFRVEARSDSLLMMTLDPIEELILSRSDLVVGQPVAQIREERVALSAELAAMVRASEPARTFAVTNPRVDLEFPDDRELEVRAIALVDSSRIHLRAEAFVDLNNDDRPAEFEGFAGWRWGIVEPFIVLNVLTEDVDFRTDVGLGLYEGSWFAGGAWDISEGAPKGFASWSPIPQMRLSAEVYRQDDDGQTQLGVLYQPTQQLGVGAFTDTDGLWWIRTSFRL